MNGFVRVSADPVPTGWFRVFTVSGAPAGLGFQCPKCHLGYRHSAPAEIFHCGALEKAPRITSFLPEQSLGGPIFPTNIVPVGF